MKRVGALQYVTYNIYWLSINMASNSLTPLILPYLVARYVGEATKGSAYGLLRSAGLLVAIFVQPLAGMLSDRSTSRWGRRRPFILVGTLMNLLFLAVMALTRSYWLLLAATLLLQFSSNIAHGALQGIIPDMVPQDQRGRASSVKAIMELLPVILAAFTTGRLVSEGHVQAAIALIAAVFLGTMIITVLAVREEPVGVQDQPALRPAIRRIVMLTLVFALATTGFGATVGLTGRMLVERPALQLAGVAAAGLLAMAGAIVVGVWASARIGLGDKSAGQDSAFIWWVVNRLLFLAAVGSISSFAQYFLQDVLGVPNAPGATAKLMLAVGISTLVAAIPSGWISDRVGRKPLVVAAGFVAAAGTFLLFVAHDMPGVYLCGAVIGLATGAFMTTNWALGTELVPAAEAGRYLGISNLAGAGAGIVGTGIGGPMADFFNAYQRGLGYLVIFAIYGVLFLLSALVILQVRQPERSLSDR